MSDFFKALIAFLAVAVVAVLIALYGILQVHCLLTYADTPAMEVPYICRGE